MLRSIFWKPYSRLLIVGDRVGWAISTEVKALHGIARKLGIPTYLRKRVRLNIPQVVHYASQFSLKYENIYKKRHRISVDYYHGKPHQGDSFRECFEALKKHHNDITKVRVSNMDMELLIKSSGIDSSKVMRIPIGIDPSIFLPTTLEKKLLARKHLDIPENATVIGSFQKDGVGWEEGLEPKLIKGPDIFLKVIEKLKVDIPNLWVLLSGPARGYVKKGLDELGIPYRHQYLKDPEKLTDFYDTLDLYIITSREEGGPKSCLESMAKGVPLVTTEVGQCKDLVINSKNAMMAPIDDVSKLHDLSLEVLRDGSLREGIVRAGFITANENSYTAQLILWKEYFKDLITS